MPERDPDELDHEPEERPEDPAFDPYVWLGLIRIDVPEELFGVPFS